MLSDRTNTTGRAASERMGAQGKVFGAGARFDGYGSTYAERGTAVHTPGAGTYTPLGTRTSARKKSVVRLQAAFRGAISRRMSRGLFAEEMAVARSQPGPGDYETHTINTIARLTAPTEGEVSCSSAFRDTTDRFRSAGSIYSTRTPKSETASGAWARAKVAIPFNSGDSADKLRAAAQSLLHSQLSQRAELANPARQRSRPATAPATAAVGSGSQRVQPAEAGGPPAAAQASRKQQAAPPSRPPPEERTLESALRALKPIDEARPEPSSAAPSARPPAEEVSRGAAELARRLAGLELGGGAGRKVRFSVGITVGSYEPLAQVGDLLISPVVSEGGTTRGAYEPLAAQADGLAPAQPQEGRTTPRYSQGGTAFEGYDDSFAPRSAGRPGGETQAARPLEAAESERERAAVAALAELSGPELLARLRLVSADQVDEEDYFDSAGGVWDVDGLKSDLALALNAATL